MVNSIDKVKKITPRKRRISLLHLHYFEKVRENGGYR